MNVLTNEPVQVKLLGRGIKRRERTWNRFCTVKHVYKLLYSH